MNFTFIGWLVRPRCKICKQRVQVLLSKIHTQARLLEIWALVTFFSLHVV